MHPATTFRILGLLIIVFSATFILPIAVSVIYAEANHVHFIWSLLITFTCGVLLWLPFSSKKLQKRRDMYPRDGYIITVLFWLVLSLFGTLPFLLQQDYSISFTNAMFESVSGLTTTGATVLSGLDNLPKSLLFYRQQLQWLGGIGIIVIAVAVLPLLGIGGMQLYRTEAPGPGKDSKLTPRIAETAKALFMVYSVLTLACMLAYWAAGMNLFDAISHSFSTVAIGGFSTHDSSMGYFNDKPLILLIAAIFMLLSGLNYALHFYSFIRKSMGHYFDDLEARTYFLLLIAAILLVVSGLQMQQGHNTVLGTTLIQGVFQTISIVTTTGFTNTNFSNWPGFIPILLIMVAIIGACAGSTGGGIKVIRLLILFKQSIRQMRLMIHPHAVFPIKVNNQLIDDTVIDSVWAFLGVYIAVFCTISILLMVTGLDFLTAWSATSSSLANLGPALGEFALNYDSASVFAKWLLCFGMLLGRLELFTLLVLFVPMFWRK